MSYPDLKKALVTLAVDTIEKVKQHKDARALEAVSCEMVPVTQIDYTSETYIPDWENIVYSDHYVWRTEPLRDFIDNKIKVLPSFAVALLEIQNAFNGDEAWSRNIGLERFVRVFIDHVPNEAFSTERRSYSRTTHKGLCYHV